MKLKKRKIKYAAIFFICWFALLVFLVDGILKFQTLVDYFGSYALVEISLSPPMHMSQSSQPMSGISKLHPRGIPGGQTSR